MASASWERVVEGSRDWEVVVLKMMRMSVVFGLGSAGMGFVMLVGVNVGILGADEEGSVVLGVVKLSRMM